jgi:inosine-uridine nucleoside N-ribohydrolase
MIAAAKDTNGPHAEKVIIDTDIGDDIDDAFAVALALRTSELDILGFSVAFGNTAARASIIDRMLRESDHGNIPVAIGHPTPPFWSWLTTGIGRQRRYGDGAQYTRTSHPAAVDFILEQINRFPQQITLVTIGPLTNVGVQKAQASGVDGRVDRARKSRPLWLRDKSSTRVQHTGRRRFGAKVVSLRSGHLCNAVGCDQFPWT